MVSQVAAVGSLDAEREQIAKLHGTFETIAETIGVIDPNAIIEKFTGQEETFAMLSNLHRACLALHRTTPGHAQSLVAGRSLLGDRCWSLLSRRPPDRGVCTRRHLAAEY
jgi:hypothetical protein